MLSPAHARDDGETKIASCARQGPCARSVRATRLAVASICFTSYVDADVRACSCMRRDAPVFMYAGMHIRRKLLSTALLGTRRRSRRQSGSTFENAAVWMFSSRGASKATQRLACASPRCDRSCSEERVCLLGDLRRHSLGLPRVSVC